MPLTEPGLRRPFTEPRHFRHYRQSRFGGNRKMKLTKDQFEREGNYRIALHIISTLLGKGLLSHSEFQRAKILLIEKYKPVWGHYPDIRCDDC